MKNATFLPLILLALTLSARADNPAGTSAAPGSKEVKLCDNKTTVQVPNDTPKTRAEGQKISDALMAQWKASNPNSDWVRDKAEAHQAGAPQNNSNWHDTA